MLSPVYANRTSVCEYSVTKVRCDPPKRNEGESVPEIPIALKTTPTTLNVPSVTHTVNPERPTRYSHTIPWSLQNTSRNRPFDTMCWLIILLVVAHQLLARPINELPSINMTVHKTAKNI